MFSTRRNFNFLVIFIVVLLNDCQACFRSNEHQKYSITTGSSFYKECQCTEPGATTHELTWFDSRGQPIPSLRPGTDSNMYVEELDDSINLHITSIDKAMSGVYKCVANIDGKMYVQSYNVAAYEPLYFYQTPDDQNLIYKQNGTIYCQPRSDSVVFVTWQKGSEEAVVITDDENYKIVPEGLSIAHVTKEDADVYKCTALVIDTNEEVDKYITVKVITVPEIKSLKVNPSPTVAVGEYLSIECIADGTPYPKYLWNKTLEEGAEANVTWRQEENSIIFDSIQPDDRGIYTCDAVNEAGSNKMKTFVEVLIPPEIISFPNITDVEGSTVQLICNATGRPEPNVSIIYVGKDLDSDTDQIDYDVIPNKAFVTLIRSQEGIYVCNASNEVDMQQRAMYLTVLHRPYFVKAPDRIWGWEGKTINLSCNVDSNPPAYINWKFQGNDILTEEQVEINRNLLLVLNSMSEQYFTLNIDNNTAYGIFECSARNELGEATKFITLKKGFKPDDIHNASIVNQTATSVTFAIYGPEKVNGPAIQGYTAQYDEAKNYNVTDIHINRTWSIDRPFKLDKLKPNSTYYVKFAAINEVGTGVWSEYLTFTTQEKSVPEPPMWEADPITLTSTSHVLKWKASDDNGEPIDYYTLRYCAYDTEVDDQLCKVQRISPTTKLELTDLEFNTTYFLELVAHNAEGDSIPSNISVTVPTPDIDSPTTILSSGAIIAIALVIVVLCLLLLDVLLLVWRRQGIIASCCCKKENENKENTLNSRDRKGLLTNGETGDEVQAGTKANNGHKEYEYNKNTGVVTGKHSAV